MKGRDEICCVFFFQAEDGIRDLVRSRGLGDVYKRQAAKIATGHYARITDDPISPHIKWLKIAKDKTKDLSLIHI